jgi:hypothetical protein
VIFSHKPNTTLDHVMGMDQSLKLHGQDAKDSVSFSFSTRKLFLTHLHKLKT